MFSDKLNLTGKTALVTGSTQGIGKGIALALAECGADVFLHYRNDASDAEEVLREIAQFGVKTYVIGADLSEPDAAERIVQQVYEKVGKLDILVLNASMQIAKIWTELTADDFDIQVNTNFKSTMLLMQRFVPQMVNNGWGRVVTLGSVQQIKPHPSMIVYAATKSAVLNLVQNVAMQVADKGVTINNLAPGVIGTPRIGEYVPEPEERINQRLGTPSGHIGSPEDCAAMAVLLCSEAGRFITGQNIYVDGGMSL